MKEYLDFALEIAEFAKKEMLDHFDSSFQFGFKPDRTIVTETDKKINHYLIEKVHETYPNHSVVGEEESDLNPKKQIWVCDPIDGTGVYTDGIPVSVFSLAYVEDGIPQVGVVMDPFLNKCYTAVRGEGAFCNGKPIHVNDKHLGDLGYRVNFEMWNHAKFNTLSVVGELLKSARISCIGSVARSCMAIASGHFSCDLFPGTEHANCDMAASSLIVEEAGGKVTDFEGNPQRFDQDLNGVLITNGVSHDEILQKVKTYMKTKPEVE